MPSEARLEISEVHRHPCSSSHTSTFFDLFTHNLTLSTESSRESGHIKGVRALMNDIDDTRDRFVTSTMESHPQSREVTARSAVLAHHNTVSMVASYLSSKDRRSARQAFHGPLKGEPWDAWKIQPNAWEEEVTALDMQDAMIMATHMSEVSGIAVARRYRDLTC